MNSDLQIFKYRDNFLSSGSQTSIQDPNGKHDLRSSSPKTRILLALLGVFFIPSHHSGGDPLQRTWNSSFE